MNTKRYITILALFLACSIKAQYILHIDRTDDDETYEYELNNLAGFRWWDYNWLEVFDKNGKFEHVLGDKDKLKRLWWTKAEKSEDSDVQQYLSPENLEVVTEDYSIKLDATVLEDTVPLTVKRRYDLPPLYPGHCRSSIVLDFDLGGYHELNGTAEIRIPFLVSSDYIPCAAYYNEETHKWEPVNFKYDATTGEVVIRTSHLSEYGAFSIEKAYSRQEFIKYAYYPFVETTVQQTIDFMINVMQSSTPEAEAINYFLEDLDALKTMELDIKYSALEALGLLPSLSEEFKSLVGNLGTAYSIYQIMQADLQGDDVKVAGNTLKLVVNQVFGTITSALSSAVMTASLVAVAYIDYALNKFATEAWEGRKGLYEGAYFYYYSRAGKKLASDNKKLVGYRSATDWYHVFMPLFRRTDLSQKELDELINKEVNDYCWEFWTDESVISAALDEARNLGFTGGGGMLSSIQRELANRHRDELFSGVLVSVFQAIKNKMEDEAYDKMEIQAENFSDFMNKVVKIRIKDSSKTEKGSDWKGHTVTFGEIPKDITDPQDWACKLDENGEGVIMFRLFPYLHYKFSPKLAVLNEDGEKVKFLNFKLDLVNGEISPTIDVATEAIDVPMAVDSWDFEVTPELATGKTNTYETFGHNLDDNWPEAIKQAFAIERVIDLNTDGTFSLQTDQLEMNGYIDPATKTGSGTFKAKGTYHYVAEHDFIQDFINRYNKAYQEALSGFNETYVFDNSFVESFMDEMDTMWKEYNCTASVTGTFKIKFSQKEQRYVLDFSGDGILNLAGDAIAGPEYAADDTIIDMTTLPASLHDGEVKMSASMLFGSK